MGDTNLQFPWATPRRKTLAPDGSYRDSPLVSDGNGWSGQGELTDPNSGYNSPYDAPSPPSPPPTVDRHSTSDNTSPYYNPPSIKPTESEAAPSASQANPSMSMGDRIPAGPPGYTPMSSPPRSLTEGMAQPQQYTDYQNAINNPKLHPHTSTLRQVLGGLVSSVASGMFAPLGDTVRYGAQGASDLRDARNQLQVTNAAREAQLAQDKESQTAANQAILRRQAEDTIRNNAWNHQDTINQHLINDANRDKNTWEANMGRLGATPMPEGASLQDPTTQYVPSAALPQPQATQAIPSRQPFIGPVNPQAPQPQPQPQQGMADGAGPDISTLPTKTFNPGAYMTPQMQIPKGYATSMPPPSPQMGANGRVSMIPPRESAGMVIPLRSVMEQQKAEMAGNETIDTPADYVDKYGPKITRSQLSQAITANKGPKKDDNYWLNASVDPNSSPELKRQSKAYLDAKIAQTLAGRPITQNNIQGMPPSSNTSTGSAYLSALPPGVKGEVEAMANGDAPAPSKSSRAQAAVQKLQAVYQYDPKFDENRYKFKSSYKDTRNGTNGGAINSANTLIDHIGVLNNLATALQNHDTPAISAVVNYVQKQLGHPEVTNVGTALTAVSNEAERLFRQAGTSEGGIAAWKEAINVINASPDQAKGKVGTILKILGGRTTELANSFRRGMNRRDESGKAVNNHPVDEQFIQGFFSPQARETLQKLGFDPDSLLGVKAGGGEDGQYSPAVEKMISDGIANHLAKDRNEAVKALKDRGVIK